MSKDFVALVPVREGSERVTNKNFRRFHNNKSLFDLKILQLKKSNIFDKIYVSSDSLKVKSSVRNMILILLKKFRNVQRSSLSLASCYDSYT